MDQSLPILDDLRIASPCQANWDAMTGNDRHRSCGICDKEVYDLSAMTTAEALALVAGAGPMPCVRYYQRTDGTILTTDCPVGLRAVHRRRTRRFAELGMAGLTLISAVAAVLGIRRDLAPSTSREINLDLTDRVAPTPPAPPDFDPNCMARMAGGNLMPSVQPGKSVAIMGMGRIGISRRTASTQPGGLVPRMGEPTAIATPTSRPFVSKAEMSPEDYTTTPPSEDPDQP